MTRKYTAFIIFAGLAFSITQGLAAVGNQTHDLASQEKVEKEKAAALRKDLTPKAQFFLDEIEAQFEIIKANDAQRVVSKKEEAAYDDPDLASYLIKEHQARLSAWLGKKELKKASPNDLKADSELLKSLRRTLRKENERISRNLRKADPGRAKSINRRNLALEKSQKAWLKYGDAWVRLLERVKPHGFLEDKDIEISVKTSLTRQRIDEYQWFPGFTGD